MSALNEAVARAIADVRYAPGKGGLVTAQAEAAIGVVLAEAQQSIEAAIDASDDYYIGGYVNDELHRLVEAALAALAGDAA